jgi:hypothetical protein
VVAVLEASVLDASVPPVPLLAEPPLPPVLPLLFELELPPLVLVALLLDEASLVLLPSPDELLEVSPSALPPWSADPQARAGRKTLGTSESLNQRQKCFIGCP